jgi:hypothetical protein
MLQYYHGCLLKHLRQVKDYELQTASVSAKVSSAVATLKAAVQAVLDGLDGLPGQQSQDSPIPESLLITLQQALTAWRTQVGPPDMHFYSKQINGYGPLVGRYQPASGEDNMVIYEVTELVRECETYSQNIQAVLLKAKPAASKFHPTDPTDPTLNPKAHMQALLLRVRNL